MAYNNNNKYQGPIRRDNFLLFERNESSSEGQQQQQQHQHRQQFIREMSMDLHDILRKMDYEETNGEIGSISVCSNSGISIGSLGVAIGVGIGIELNGNANETTVSHQRNHNNNNNNSSSSSSKFYENNHTKQHSQQMHRSVRDISMDLYDIMQEMQEEEEKVTANVLPNHNMSDTGSIELSYHDIISIAPNNSNPFLRSLRTFDWDGLGSFRENNDYNNHSANNNQQQQQQQSWPIIDRTRAVRFKKIDMVHSY